ncbi:histone-like nucleoid-structuring protein Lsr2 [Tsukamurella hominis]|uniref:histone-like nucleoid-structuring protein Lsr2 n=1 Tax=Tsukamurella hominis TaxID=1970232 RepID=UPI0039E9491C
MTKVTQTQLVDDLDHTPSESIETIDFMLDGQHYEIDLNSAHAQQLRTELGTWIPEARRTGGRKHPTQSHPELALTPDEAPLVRSWAAANGYPVAPAGRIPYAAIAAYRKTRLTSAN